MLAREYCEAAKIKNKPVILSHHMLFGLKQGQEKMSKSDPDSAIFMEDAASDVERKILNAYCPTKPEESEGSKGKDGNDAANVDAGKESMHLVEDSLKNPCLDYVQHIIFSPPDATFTVGEATYKDFASVKTKFLSGEITPEQLKRGLISSLNTLLEPVRNHFTTNERAKDLLAKVQQYKKESKEPSAKDKVVRRLNAVELGVAPAASHVVFAPMPSSNPTLQEAMDLLSLLRQCSSSDTPRILFLSDWSARVCNACGGELKGIDAYYTVLTTALKVLDPEFMSSKVRILTQSKMILADPSNYWISVINVGRHFPLNTVMGIGESDALKDSDGAGSVIARLMRVADVAGLEPSSIALLESDSASRAQKVMIDQFYQDGKLPGLSAPSVSIHQGPNLLLQQRESIAHKTDNDEYYLLDDPKVR